MAVRLQLDERTMLTSETSAGVLEWFGYPEKNSFEDIQEIIMRHYELKKKSEPTDVLSSEKHNPLFMPTVYVLKHISERIEVPLKPDQNGIVAVEHI
ncbi:MULTISPECIES: hypothetical protein [Bacillus]|uniref:hypothetical protein n=1 Tax=Bacillus TaxID=1386 RepID=UPI00065336BD|nr:MULTISPECIES: hypothetical protein [Bacillus]KMN57345.1 hypothetical protein VK94_06570 [Bacillus sp. LK7]UVF85966.1 hypothetical protein NWE25_09800 [Bacillus velezensis]